MQPSDETGVRLLPLVVPTLDQAIGPACTEAAADATDRFRVEHPEIVDRYGEAGLAYARHDFAYLIAWAVDAAALDSPSTFARNALWLHGLLASRGFPLEWLVRSFELARDVSADRGLLTAADAARIVDPVIEQVETHR
jgi:hypothetical protein